MFQQHAVGLEELELGLVAEEMVAESVWESKAGYGSTFGSVQDPKVALGLFLVIVSTNGTCLE